MKAVIDDLVEALTLVGSVVPRTRGAVVMISTMDVPDTLTVVGYNTRAIALVDTLGEDTGTRFKIGLTWRGAGDLLAQMKDLQEAGRGREEVTLRPGYMQDLYTMTYPYERTRTTLISDIADRARGEIPATQRAEFAALDLTSYNNLRGAEEYVGKPMRTVAGTQGTLCKIGPRLRVYVAKGGTHATYKNRTTERNDGFILGG